MDVLIFGGQINKQGQTESCPPHSPVPGAYEYRHASGSLLPLAHPVGENFGELLLAAHEGHGSLVPAFCRAYLAAQGGEATAVHAAKGATVIADWAPGSERYRFALEKIRAGISLGRGAAGRVFYIWLQGESDALAGTSEEEYLRALVAYKNALKRDAGIEKFAIIRVGFFTGREAPDLRIMLAQERAAASDGDFLVLTRSCAALSRDPAFLNPFAAGHYGNAGMETIGAEAGAALAAYANGGDRK